VKKAWLCTAKTQLSLAHRTVRCTRLNPGEQAALGRSLATYDYNSPDCSVVHRTVRCARLNPGEQAALGRSLATYDYNSPDCSVVHRTVR
jgi:hypothetical protein